MALDGKTGKTIWKTWTDHKVFAITCQADLNGDSVVDCVVGGMSGVRRFIFYTNITLHLIFVLFHINTFNMPKICICF